MVLLALDASSKVTGWSILQADNANDISLVAFGEIPLNKFKKKANPLQYVKVLYDEISHIILTYSPDLCYIEDIFARNLVTYKSLSRIRGICEIACLNNHIDKIYAVNASSARKVALGEGKGGTKSDAICTILEVRFGKSLATKDFDQSDSILLGICGVKLYYANSKTGTSKRRPRATKQSDSSSKKIK